MVGFFYTKKPAGITNGRLLRIKDSVFLKAAPYFTTLITDLALP